jgi:hypothetical protein
MKCAACSTHKGKFEARSSKFETNSNDRKFKGFKQSRLALVLEIVTICSFSIAPFVSDFDIRISTFLE